MLNPTGYYTAYQPDLNAALQGLRQREFQAGRYNPAVTFLEFPITENQLAPGAQHPTIEAALEASGADGTRSIPHILRVSYTPCPYSRGQLQTLLMRPDGYEVLERVFAPPFFSRLQN